MRKVARSTYELAHREGRPRLTEVWLIVRCRNGVRSFPRVRRRITVPVDRLWHHVRCDSIAKLVRVQDKLGHGSEVDVSRFVSENELLSGLVTLKTHQKRL